MRPARVGTCCTPCCPAAAPPPAPYPPALCLQRQDSGRLLESGGLGGGGSDRGVLQQRLRHPGCPGGRGHAGPRSALGAVQRCDTDSGIARLHVASMRERRLGGRACTGLCWNVRSRGVGVGVGGRGAVSLPVLAPSAGPGGHGAHRHAANLPALRPTQTGTAASSRLRASRSCAKI